MLVQFNHYQPTFPPYFPQSNPTTFFSPTQPINFFQNQIPSNSKYTNVNNGNLYNRNFFQSSNSMGGNIGGNYLNKHDFTFVKDKDFNINIYRKVIISDEMEGEFVNLFKKEYGEDWKIMFEKKMSIFYEYHKQLGKINTFPKFTKKMFDDLHLDPGDYNEWTSDVDESCEFMKSLKVPLNLIKEWQDEIKNKKKKWGKKEFQNSAILKILKWLFRSNQKINKYQFSEHKSKVKEVLIKRGVAVDEKVVLENEIEEDADKMEIDSDRELNNEENKKEREIKDDMDIDEVLETGNDKMEIDSNQKPDNNAFRREREKKKEDEMDIYSDQKPDNSAFRREREKKKVDAYTLKHYKSMYLCEKLIALFFHILPCVYQFGRGFPVHPDLLIDGCMFLQHLLHYDKNGLRCRMKKMFSAIKFTYGKYWKKQIRLDALKDVRGIQKKLKKDKGFEAEAITPYVEECIRKTVDPLDEEDIKLEAIMDFEISTLIRATGTSKFNVENVVFLGIVILKGLKVPSLKYVNHHRKHLNQKCLKITIADSRNWKVLKYMKNFNQILYDKEEIIQRNSLGLNSRKKKFPLFPQKYNEELRLKPEDIRTRMFAFLSRCIFSISFSWYSLKKFGTAILFIDMKEKHHYIWPANGEASIAKTRGWDKLLSVEYYKNEVCRIAPTATKEEFVQELERWKKSVVLIENHSDRESVPTSILFQSFMLAHLNDELFLRYVTLAGNKFLDVFKRNGIKDYEKGDNELLKYDSPLTSDFLKREKNKMFEYYVLQYRDCDEFNLMFCDKFNVKSMENIVFTASLCRKFFVVKFEEINLDNILTVKLPKVSYEIMKRTKDIATLEIKNNPKLCEVFEFNNVYCDKNNSEKIQSWDISKQTRFLEFKRIKESTEFNNVKNKQIGSKLTVSMEKAFYIFVFANKQNKKAIIKSIRTGYGVFDLCNGLGDQISNLKKKANRHILSGKIKTLKMDLLKTNAKIVTGDSTNEKNQKLRKFIHETFEKGIEKEIKEFFKSKSVCTNFLSFGNGDLSKVFSENEVLLLENNKKKAKVFSKRKGKKIKKKKILKMKKEDIEENEKIEKREEKTILKKEIMSVLEVNDDDDLKVKELKRKFSSYFDLMDTSNDSDDGCDNDVEMGEKKKRKRKKKKKSDSEDEDEDNEKRERRKKKKKKKKRKKKKKSDTEEDEFIVFNF